MSIVELLTLQFSISYGDIFCISVEDNEDHQHASLLVYPFGGLLSIALSVC
jgi:hypothetical protein